MSLDLITQSERRFWLTEAIKWCSIGDKTSVLSNKGFIVKKIEIIFYSGLSVLVIAFVTFAIQGEHAKMMTSYTGATIGLFFGAYLLLDNIQERRAWKKQRALRETPLLFEWDEDTNTVHA